MIRMSRKVDAILALVIYHQQLNIRNASTQEWQDHFTDLTYELTFDKNVQAPSWDRFADCLLQRQ